MINLIEGLMEKERERGGMEIFLHCATHCMVIYLEQWNVSLRFSEEIYLPIKTLLDALNGIARCIRVVIHQPEGFNYTFRWLHFFPPVRQIRFEVGIQIKYLHGRRQLVHTLSCSINSRQIFCEFIY